jgi:hypothetical protein
MGLVDNIDDVDKAEYFRVIGTDVNEFFTNQDQNNYCK